MIVSNSLIQDGITHLVFSCINRLIQSILCYRIYRILYIFSYRILFLCVLVLSIAEHLFRLRHYFSFTQLKFLTLQVSQNIIYFRHVRIDLIVLVYLVQIFMFSVDPHSHSHILCIRWQLSCFVP